METLVERGCGLDVHQATVVACLLMVGKDGKVQKQLLPACDDSGLNPAVRRAQPAVEALGECQYQVWPAWRRMSLAFLAD
jgi:hypothetical protein